MIDAISLKAAIIDLAVSGKLSSDFCATDSVTEIVSSLPSVSPKREKLLSQSFDYGKQFLIPEHWRWIPLGKISSYGDTPEKAYYSDVTSDTWILDLEDIKAGGEIIEKTRVEKKKFIGDKTVFKKGQVLYSKLRPYLKKVLVADEDGVSTPELIAFDTYGGILPQYIVYCLLSSFVDRAIDKRSYGVKMPRIDAGFMVNLPIPLPPISEQRLIVDRVEKVFLQISTIDALQSQYQDNLATLKSKIIDAGIQGKLTEQLPEDGTAEELYQQIQQEKLALEKAGKIKKSKPLPPISDDEILFDAPDTWKWVRLGEIIQFLTSGSRDWAKYYSSSGDVFLRMGNLSRSSFRLRLDNIQHVNLPEDAEGKRTSLQSGDLLFSITGEIGMLGLIPDDFGKAYINQHTAMIRFIDIQRNKYVPYLLLSYYAKEYFEGNQHGIKNSFNLDSISNMPIPLPPLAEQKRIVAKLEELLPLCEG